MKLVRWGDKGREKPGAIDAEGAIRDLSAVAADWAGDAVSCEALSALRGLDLGALPRVEGAPRLGPCLAWVPNFHAIGLNYRRHAAEVGAAPPPEPILFSKATTCLAGPHDDLTLPRGSVKSDWEVELGVVIGAWVEHVSEADALACVAGYCVVNDLSEREWQIERKGQWVKGKSAPGFGPVGPWLVTADEIADPQNLDLELRLNGETVQKSNTSDMVFGVAEIIAYMSRFMALRPGDLIATGTPEGVGMGMKPARFLRAGDAMTLSVQGLGEQRQRVVG